MTKHKKIIVGERATLVKNPLIVDGISRAGKFLLTNLLSGIAGVEPAQYRPVMEHVSRLQRFGLIDGRAAQELLRAEADMACWEMLIGRNFNHRRSDKSSIFNNARYKTYLPRLRRPDGEAALAEFRKKKLLSLFIVHETFPNVNLFFNSFPGLKVAVLERSPLDLVYSWRRRKLGARIGSDPLMGEIPLCGKAGNIPWYLYGCQQEYHAASGIDRTILAISTLVRMYEQTFAKLAPGREEKVLRLCYEDIIAEPEAVLRRAARFLGRSVLPELKLVIRKEKLPNKNYFLAKKRKIRSIRRAAAKKYFDILMILEKEYDNNKNS